MKKPGTESSVYHYGLNSLWLIVVILGAFFSIFCPKVCDSEEISWSPKEGMAKSDLLSHFSKDKERTYRVEGREEWITLEDKAKDKIRLVTFYIKDGRLSSWKWNDRREVTREYMGEFCSEALLNSPKIRSAIRDVFERIPEEIFLFVTRRDFPALFVEYYTKGNPRLSNSGEVRILKDDPPTFGKGIWIVKINSELEQIADKAAVEAIVAHELAHRVLRQAPEKNDTAEKERAANRLIKKWGFEKEFLSARALSRSSEK